MSSTKEKTPQIVVKAYPKPAPAERPPANDPLPSTEPARVPHEVKPSGLSGSAPPMPTGNPLGWFLLLALLIAGTAVGGAYYHASQQVVDDTHLVMQGNIDVRQVNLAFKVGGRIASLEVDEGDPVSAGQTVATLEGEYFEDDLRLAMAQRDEALAQLEKLENGSRSQEIAGAKAQVAERLASLGHAQQNFERARSLITKHAVTKEFFDAMKGALEEAEARLNGANESLSMIETGPRPEEISAARAQLAAQDANLIQVQRKLADAVLVAPSDGVVLTRAREKGAIVSPGETIFAQTLDRPVWARTYVPEPDLGKISPGMAAFLAELHRFAIDYHKLCTRASHRLMVIGLAEGAAELSNK